MSPHDLESFDTEQKRLDEARRHFERVLEQCRQQAPWGADVCLPEMATALSNLGVMHRSQSRPQETLREDYEEALQIDRQLDQRDPLGRYRSYLVGTLINLAGLDLLQNRMDESRQHYEEALQTYRQLASKPEVYLPDMAMALANLGTVDQNQKRLDEGRQNYEEALKTYSRLEQQNPGAFLPAMAGTLSNLGSLERLENRIEESRADYSQALIIYRKLAQGDSGTYAGEVARVEASLAGLPKKASSR